MARQQNSGSIIPIVRTPSLFLVAGFPTKPAAAVKGPSLIIDVPLIGLRKMNTSLIVVGVFVGALFGVSALYSQGSALSGDSSNYSGLCSWS
jgi:hypothetical protein